MKVLQINAVYEHSSTGRSTTEMHKYLLAEGYDSYVAAVNLPKSDGNLIKLGTRLSSIFHAFMSHLTGRQGYYSYFSTKSLLRKINKIKPDIVYLRVLHSNCLYIPALLSYLADNNIPTAIILHDCWFFTGHCCYFTDANCDKWKAQCGQCPELKTWNKSWFFDRSRKNLLDKKRLFSRINKLAVIGVSDWVTNLIQESILKNAAIVKRIYNWVDIEKFKPTNNDIRNKLGLQNDFVVLGVAQNWNTQKGILDILKIADLMPDYIFVLVGNISQKYCPLPTNIINVGVLSSERDLSDYYSMSDVFFNPSMRETFGKVTIEALSCGTPVIGYNLTATPELISPSCGFVTEQSNYGAVINALQTIQKKGKNVYSVNCRHFVINNFSQKKIMSEHINLYKQLVQ